MSVDTGYTKNVVRIISKTVRKINVVCVVKPLFSRPKGTFYDLTLRDIENFDLLSAEVK